jgi:Winged helix-turn helix
VDRLQHQHHGKCGRAAGAGACGARETRRRSGEAIAAAEERCSVRQAAATLGYSERQAQRWWARYARGGLAALLDVGRPGGSHERITPEAWADLRAQMRAGAIGRLKDAQRALGDRLLLGRHLEAVHPAQDQAEDGPPAPPPRGGRRAGGVQKISSPPRLRGSTSGGFSRSTRRASGSRSAIVGAGAPSAHGRPGSTLTSTSGSGSMSRSSRRRARAWCSICRTPTGSVSSASCRRSGVPCPRCPSLSSSTARAATPVSTSAGRPACSRCRYRATARSLYGAFCVKRSFRHSFLLRHLDGG